MSSKEKAFESILEKPNKNMEKNHYGKTETHNMKKAIFELDRDLFVELKVLSAKTGRPMREIVAEALKRYLQSS